MKTKWNLSVLYSGLDDPAYEADMKAFEESNQKLHELVETASEKPLKERIEGLLLCMEERMTLIMRLSNFQGLSLSVNTKDGKMMAEDSRLMKLYAAGAADSTAAERIFGEIPDIDALAAESDLIRSYSYLLKETKKNCAHLLSNEVEAMISAMDMTGGTAWSNLQNYLTSTVKVDYNGTQVTLSEIRNLAYSADPAVRKAAYEAELACYDKIADSVAFALNNIKNQVTMLSSKKGFASPLAQALEQAKMSRETLDALMAAIEEYLPTFRKYLRRKAEKLGYKNGLPWYELFAPLGSSEKKFSLEECRDYLLGCFDHFSSDMSAMMKEAFDNEWIDFYPRDGKSGGAFCAGLMEYRQSRILTNYDGTFGAVDTLAHELGHAFHNRQMENERVLNQDYPMPVAETASTFNEVFLGAYALSNAASDDERLALLESNLRETTQCIVDIYSRYLFETAVFEQSQNQFLMADDLKNIMLDAQKKAYGDGLDPDYMHPYMWVCKSHYYSSGLSFYNFPYAFGNLFAQGLYALYLKQGDAFVNNYKEMLRTTSIHSIEEDGAELGIDLTKKEFWEASLAMLAQQVDQFCKL